MSEPLILFVVLLAGVALLPVSAARTFRAFHHKKIGRFFVLGWSDPEVELSSSVIGLDEPFNFACEVLLTVFVGLAGSVAMIYLGLERIFA